MPQISDTQPIKTDFSRPNSSDKFFKRTLLKQIQGFSFANDYLKEHLPKHYFWEIKREKRTQYTFLGFFGILTILFATYILISGLFNFYNLAFIMFSVAAIVSGTFSIISVTKIFKLKTSLRLYLLNRDHFDGKNIFPSFILNIYKHLRLNLTHLSWLSAYAYFFSILASLFFLLIRGNINWSFWIININWEAPGNWVTPVLIGILIIFSSVVVIQVCMNILIRKRIVHFVNVYGMTPTDEELIIKYKDNLNKNYRWVTLAMALLLAFPVFFLVRYFAKRKR